MIHIIKLFVTGTFLTAVFEIYYIYTTYNY